MPLAEVVGDRIAVETKWTEKELIKQVPGCRWEPELKVWTVPLTWAACLQLRGIFGDALTIGSQLNQWSWREVTERVRPAEALRTSIEHQDGYANKLYDFQTAGAEFLLTSGGALLGDDMGMGKTAQLLAVLTRLIERDPDTALPALVICPNSVKAGWEREAHNWQVDVTPYVITGSAAERRKRLAAAKNDPHALVIINIEAVRQFSRLAPFGSISLKRCRECDPRRGEEGVTPARCEVHLKELNTLGFRTVILDEAHRTKDPTSKQTRACWAVGHGDTVRNRYAMTGTPIANHVGDLWSIMHFIAPDEYPTKSRFIDRYALQAWNAFGGIDIVGVNPGTRDEFYRILDSRFRRTPKALVLTQLPRVVRATRWVDMVPKQRTAYENMAQQLVTRLDDGQFLVAPNNLVNATRLLQLSSSYANVEWVPQPLTSKSRCLCALSNATEHDDQCPDRQVLQVTLCDPSPKLDAMEESYDELGGKPVVIVAQSRQLIELAAKRFKERKVPYGMITGTVSEYDRQLALHQFKSDQLNVMLMTIAAGGTGVDGLQHADTMFCLQRSWSMVNNVQVDGRVDRIGSEKHDSVVIVDFVTRGTIEETVQYPRLIEKYERLEEINRDRARLIAAGVPSSELFNLDNAEATVLAGSLAGSSTNDVYEEDE